jgi:hypothetical protein
VVREPEIRGGLGDVPVVALQRLGHDTPLGLALSMTAAGTGENLAVLLQQPNDIPDLH